MLMGGEGIYFLEYLDAQLVSVCTVITDNAYYVVCLCGLSAWQILCSHYCLRGLLALSTFNLTMPVLFVCVANFVPARLANVVTLN